MQSPLSDLTTSVVFIPPYIKKGSIPTSVQETVDRRLNDYFSKLYLLGINQVMCLGGLHLDYVRYKIPDYLQKIMMYYDGSPNVLRDSFYDTSPQQLKWEKDNFPIHVDMAYLFSQEFEGEYALLEMRQKYGEGLTLCKNWLATQPLFLVYNYNNVVKPVKSFLNTSKQNVQLRLEHSDLECINYGQQVREELLFPK